MSNRVTRPQASAPRTRPVPVASLAPLPGLSHLARLLPEAEPPRAELVAALRAGRQPYPLVVHGTQVLYGIELREAARTVGVRAVEVAEHPGCDGLVDADLQLRAAGLHLRAARRRRTLTPIEEVCRAARLYREWALFRARRAPSRGPSPQRKAWAQRRERLIRDELGHSTRTLQRYARVDELTHGIDRMVADGRLPPAFIERAAALSTADRERLAAALKTHPFEEVRDEFFPRAAQRKTPMAAARAVRAAVRTIAIEARGRAEQLGLTAELRPIADEVVGYLSQWLAEPVPVDTLADEIAAIAGWVREVDPRATRGGRGARVEGA